jgi:hypothetical protein
MMVRRISLGMALFVLSVAGPALACSIDIPPPLTETEKAAEIAKRDRDFVESAKSARAIFSVKALTSSGENESHALFEVRHIFKGKFRKGGVLKLKTIGSSLCGAGGVKRRQTGFIILSADEPRLFNGFLWSGNIELLQKEGVLPPELPK